jgi:FixJ family two-component response regulator
MSASYWTGLETESVDESLSDMSTIVEPSEQVRSAGHGLRVHVIEQDTAKRASTSHLLMKLGCHCEIYASVSELITWRPEAGIVLIHEYPGGESVSETVSRTKAAGLTIGVVGCSEDPPTATVVKAIKAGALDYLTLPFDPSTLGEVLERLIIENSAYRESFRTRIEVAARACGLSQREREVLQLIAEGATNKMTARVLGISPRTVEIHRTNMMGKLGASSAADAVKCWIVSQDL